MKPNELRAIVSRHGGTKTFAAKLKVSQRIVQYWLAGKRRLRPVIADRIRDLAKQKEQPSLSPAAEQGMGIQNVAHG
jgi:hypothetical protein